MGGTTMENASISEAKFIIKAAEMKWPTAKPIHHSQGFDYVAKINGKWSTIQVKTAYSDGNGNGKAVTLRRCNEKGTRPYAEGDFDYLFAVDNWTYYLIPYEEVKNIKSCIRVNGKRCRKYVC